MNITDICNLALNHIGRERIADLNEDTEPARTCRMHYDLVRKTLLRDYTWSFARKHTKLALLNVDTPGWAFTYSYPNDCVIARKLYNEDESWVILEKNLPGNMDETLVNDNTKALVCNYADACLEYTYDVKDANLFPADFSQALSYYLAAAIAPALTGSDSKAAAMEQRAASYLSHSRFTQTVERNRVPEYPSKYYHARW